ncbi:homeotic protein knotted-1-like [Zea mays]|uniref:homeotic protein knotted-1-like n=1 Tax=Zea mays TaxID=4577 RepID=UPI0016529A51|nr:homeotic protein knotted-1-like [Zea mays]
MEAHLHAMRQGSGERSGLSSPASLRWPGRGFGVGASSHGHGHSQHHCHHPWASSLSTVVAPLPPQPPGAGLQLTLNMVAIKAKIISHPHYYSLLTAYLECNKVGAPPEVSARPTEIAQEVEARQRMALGGLTAATEPELDQFMEAMEFMRRVESQLNSLSIPRRSLCNILSSGYWRKSATPTNISHRWAKMAAWRIEWGVRC